MRIAILADPIDHQEAGIHVYTRYMVEAVAAANGRHEFVIVTSKHHPEIRDVEHLVVASSTLPGYAALRLAVTVPRLLRRLRVDCVLEPAHFGPFNLPASVRRVTVIHDLTPLLFPQYHPFHSRLLQRLMLPHILRKATAVVVDSRATARDVAARFPETGGKTFINHLGVESRFQPRHASDVPARYGIAPPYFLFTGAIEPRKNLITLLDAYEQFRNAAGHAAQLVFAGPKGWKNKPFFDRLARHPYRQDIRCTGYIPRDDLPALYSMALGFVYPSLYEGFGLPVVEAMRCGTPCILSRTSSLPEIGGAAALYFPPHAAHELCDRMRTLAENESVRKALRTEGFRQAAPFTWDRHARRLLALFDRLEET
jgi:glycosyltransferase involved in cell wall biosynthesis